MLQTLETIEKSNKNSWESQQGSTGICWYPIWFQSISIIPNARNTITGWERGLIREVGFWKEKDAGYFFH
jgi:hypothetical protein